MLSLYRRMQAEPAADWMLWCTLAITAGMTVLCMAIFVGARTRSDLFHWTTAAVALLLAATSCLVAGECVSQLWDNYWKRSAVRVPAPTKTA
jgi:hypothetical protein